ncbi:hypothetical protein J1N35_011500 [Gossypium stocksii]|uniref:Uncharacterized protein n=1 Tax=Gossypium stocksii TaxID=47602 RepID=A0A9D3W3Q1_9ROSI|nr:hypothetical protein J1N35_011500 [Gossypium stocksii]
MDIKAILGKSRTKESASTTPSNKSVSIKYQKRLRVKEDAPLPKESAPIKPKWRGLKKGLLSPKAHSSTVQSLLAVPLILKQPAHIADFSIQDTGPSHIEIPTKGFLISLCVQIISSPISQMAKSTQALSVEYDFLSGTLQEFNDNHKATVASLEK